MKLVYGVKDKPKAGQLIIFALQQLLAILAATICVPAQAGIPGGESAALLGAGVGTIVYLCFTKFKSPVFLGSSFAFINSMTVAWSGAVVGTASAQKGYAGLIVGAVFAGLVYVIIALVVKFCGTKWIDKIMPPVVIGPTVAIIGLGLATTAVTECFSWASAEKVGNSFFYNMTANAWVSLACALIALFAVILVSVFGKKLPKLIPYVIGIGAGYIAATIFTLIGRGCDIPELILIDFDAFSTFEWIPNVAVVEGAKGFSLIDGKYIATLAVAYAPVAFVVFAEHLADHKNISSIIERDLLKDKMQSMFSRGLTSFDNYMDRNNLALSQVGSMRSRLELTKERAKEQQTSFKTLADENININLTDTAIDLTNAKNALEAAQLAASKTAQQTLLNYL